MDRLRKAKGRIRGPQPDRRGRFRPPPPAPKSTKGVSLKYSSIDDAFEAVLDGADEFSNPLFDYDSEGQQQQQQQGGGSHPTAGENSWQVVGHNISPSSAEAAAAGGRTFSGAAQGKRGGREFEDSGDWSVDPLLGQIVPKPVSDPLFDGDSDRVDADSAVLAGHHHHHRDQPLGQTISESSSVSSGSLFDEDEHVGRTVSTVTDHEDRLPDQIASGHSSAKSDFLFDEDDRVREEEAPNVSRHGDEGILESVEPAVSDSENCGLESLQQRLTTEPQVEGVRVREEDPLCATATDSGDELGKTEGQEPFYETESHRGTFDEPGGSDNATTFTADPANETRTRELSSPPSSREESVEREEARAPSSTGDQTRTSFLPRLSETKIVVTCNDPEASSELPRPLRTSSPEYHSGAVLLDADPRGYTASKSSSEEPPSSEEGDLAVESKRDTLKLEDPLTHQESPLSSSCESGEHFLAGNPLENPRLTVSETTPISSSGSSAATLGLPRDTTARSPSVESGIGSSVEIPLPRPRPGNDNVLLFDASEHPLSPNTSYEEWLPPPEETTTGPQEQRDPQDSFVKIDKDDLFPIKEDYFTEEPRVKQTGYTTGRTTTSSSKPGRPAVPPRPYQRPARPVRPKPPLQKRNSAGKTAPQRPSYSPKLRRKEPARPAAVQETAVDSCGSQESRSDGAGIKVKLVEPLGRAPPSRVGKSPLPSRDSLLTASGQVGPLGLVKDDGPGYNRVSLSSSAPDTASSLTQRASPPARSHSQSKAGSPKPSAISESKITSENMKSSSATSRKSTSEVIKTDRKEDVLFDEDDNQQEGFLHNLPLEYLASVAVLLYLYFSLNIFAYVSGFLAGFLIFYLAAGAALIYYVQNVEEGRGGEAEGKSLSSAQSQEFVKRMNVDFDQLRGGYQVRNLLHGLCCIKLTGVWDGTYTQVASETGYEAIHIYM